MKEILISFPDGSSFHTRKMKVYLLMHRGPAWPTAQRYLYSNYFHVINRKFVCMRFINIKVHLMTPTRKFHLWYQSILTTAPANSPNFLHFMAWDGVWWPANPVTRHDFLLSSWNDRCTTFLMLKFFFLSYYL